VPYLLVLVLLVIPPSNSPTNPPPLSQEIVVTASTVPESMEKVPAAVTVVSRQQIEQRGATEVAEVLREVPGLYLARTGSPGKIVTLFTRGGSSKNTLVLWNGIELNDPFLSGYDWGHFSTAGVERVEIVRGPFSALYGSEAVTGVVNVLTASDRSFLSADAQLGQRQWAHGNIVFSHAAPWWYASGALEHRQDDGFAPNDDSEQDTAFAGATFRPGALSIGIQGRMVSHEVGIPRSVNATGTAFEPRLDRRERREEFQVSVPLRYAAKNISYELSAARSELRLEFEDPEDPFGRFGAETESDTDRVLGKASFSSSLGTWSGGGEYEKSVVTDVSTYGVSLDARTQSSRALFVENRGAVQLPAGQLEYALGARHDDYDTFGSEVSPRLAAAWILDGHKFRAAYGRAFRAPAVGELYIPFFGNPELLAERSRSTEIGYDRFFPSGGAVFLTAFDTRFRNLIVYDTAANRFGNIGAARSRGFELGGATPLTRSLSASISYTYLDTEDEATGRELVRRPRNSGSAGLNYQRGLFGAALVVLHSGSRLDVNDLFPFSLVMNESHTVADLKLDYTLGPVMPYLKFENLSNEAYEEVFGYPAPRRRVIAGIRWSR
jgi:vitamin B12 transporter